MGSPKQPMSAHWTCSAPPALTRKGREQGAAPFAVAVRPWLARLFMALSIVFLILLSLLGLVHGANERRREQALLKRGIGLSTNDEDSVQSQSGDSDNDNVFMENHLYV